MKTIDNYLDVAIKKNKLPSDRQLAKKIGINSASICAFRTKRSWPSDDTMVKIAGLADANIEQSLLDLNIWRNDGQARTFYEQIAKVMQSSAMIFIFAVMVFAIFGKETKAEPIDVFTIDNINYTIKT